jgi:hypothetical protein
LSGTLREYVNFLLFYFLFKKKKKLKKQRKGITSVYFSNTPAFQHNQIHLQSAIQTPTTTTKHNTITANYTNVPYQINYRKPDSFSYNKIANKTKQKQHTRNTSNYKTLTTNKFTPQED